ncbi:MAG TPA: hypothetical protein VLI39_02455, partial [Sedimentisphaerales bacterium]|nr:hypothetical protein [Sedimentisphaerales bacterium]
MSIDSPRWEWSIGEELPHLVLCSHQHEETIKDSKTLVFKSEGWPSREAAAKAADKYVPAFVLTLVLQRYKSLREPKRPTDDPIGMKLLLGGHRYGRQYDYATQAGIDPF